MSKLKNIIFPLLLLCAVGAKAQVVASVGFETDARSAGFGGAGIALDANAFSIYRNTAAISFADSLKPVAVSYGYSSLFNNAYLHTVGGYYQFNKNHAFTGGVRYYAADKIRNTEDGLNYYTVKPYDILIDLGYARKINKTLSLSINIHYILSKMNEAPGIKKGKSLALDFGLYYHKETYSAAITVDNLGKLINYGSDEYRMPASINAGGLITIHSPKITV